MSYNQDVYANPIPPQGMQQGLQPVMYETTESMMGGMPSYGRQRHRGQSSFFDTMGLNQYYSSADEQRRLYHRRREERDSDSSSSSDDDDEDNGIFQSVIGRVFRSSQSNAEYEQPQHQGGLTGMISRVVDKVTGHDRSDSGMSMMGMMPSGGFDSNFAREQHQAVYGGGMGRMANFGLDAIAAAAGAEALRMFQSRGGSNQEPGVAKQALAGLAVAEAGRLIKSYFNKIPNTQGLSKRQMKEQAAAMAAQTSLGMYNQGVGFGGGGMMQQGYGMQQQGYGQDVGYQRY